MEKLRNLSLKKTLVLYLAAGLVIGFFLSALLVMSANYVQQQIWWKYVDQEVYLEAMNRGGENYEVVVARPPLETMSASDGRISELCDVLDTYGILVISMAASCLAVYLFYRNKLQKPLAILREASRKIGANQLDCPVIYENRDEMGQLCREFETMRCQLEENNRKMWRMVEDEKALRAAIAHDIRSPLAVLRGYQEMLLEFVPQGCLDQRQTEEILRDGMGQLDRLDGFIETMRRLTRLEDRPLQLAATTGKKLEDKIRESARALAREAGKTCQVTSQCGMEEFRADEEVILEVAENLLSNALQYAAKEARARLFLQKGELVLLVTDDGCGFSEDTETVTRAFHRGNVRDSLQHFGLGMYISRVYCEKHGGTLLTENGKEGGAAVRASFKIS